MSRERVDSGRKQSGDDDRPAEKYARALIDTIRQPLLVLDSGLRVVSANPAFYRHFRTEADETVGALIWELGTAQWDVPALRDLLGRLLPARLTVEDFEVRHSFDELGPRIFLINARQVELSERRYRLILVAFEDVTERRRAERVLEHHARQLERSNRDLEEFAHAASHDLQEPLRKVRTFADRLVGSLDPASLDERQRDYLARMQDAAVRMQTRIDDLLVLARVSRRQPNRQEVNLEALVQRVMGDLESAITAADATVEVGPLPVLEADAAHLELLFQNLLANAIKYRAPGVAPMIRVESGPAEPPPKDDRDWTRITIADNGIGFEQTYAERIFRPFERLHGRGEYEGSGVGLSVCRRVVEQHGGAIGALGRPGEGATFEIRLPLTQQQPEV